MEKTTGERYIGASGPVEWLASFSPSGTNEIIGILPKRSHFLEWDQEDPEKLRHTRLGAPEQIIVRGHGAGVLPEAERMVLLPRGHGEALSDAWGNLYTEIAIAVEARS